MVTVDVSCWWLTVTSTQSGGGYNYMYSQGYPHGTTVLKRWPHYHIIEPPPGRICRASCFRLPNPSFVDRTCIVNSHRLFRPCLVICTVRSALYILKSPWTFASVTPLKIVLLFIKQINPYPVTTLSLNPHADLILVLCSWDLSY